jgi:hypothetical protein
MRVKSARSIRKGASSGQTAASLVENHARKPPSSALIANHASKPALFEVPIFQIEGINPPFFTSSLDAGAKRYLNHQNKFPL